MIDLHCHSNNSDGDLYPSELLNKAEELKLSYFSITDHNNCLAYKNLDTSNFSGTLIRGVEIVTSFEKHIIEILGYGMKIEEINLYNKKDKEEQLKYAKIIYNKLIDIFNNKGIGYTKGLEINKIIDKNCTTGKVKQYLYQDLLKYKTNKEIIGEDILSSYSNFNKKGLNNPNSILFISEYTRFPNIEEVVNLIHRNGGLCFLAHIYQYNVDNHIEFLNRILDKVKIDGVETYHSSFSKKQTEEINAYVDKIHLYKSGGSDYHGKLKPKIKLGLNLQISEEVIKPWINKVI